MQVRIASPLRFLRLAKFEDAHAGNEMQTQRPPDERKKKKASFRRSVCCEVHALLPQGRPGLGP